MVWKDEDTGTDDSLDLGFDVENEKPAEFELLPPGTYDLLVEKLEIKQAGQYAKDSEGRTLSIQFIVQTTGFTGRKLFDSIVTKNVNPEAVKIGRAKISALFKSAGVGGSDAAALIQRTVRAVVKVENARDGYDAQNRIKSYVFDKVGTPPKQAAAGTTGGPAVVADVVAGEKPKRAPPAFVKG